MHTYQITNCLGNLYFDHEWSVNLVEGSNIDNSFTVTLNLILLILSVKNLDIGR